MAYKKAPNHPEPLDDTPGSLMAQPPMPGVSPMPGMPVNYGPPHVVGVVAPKVTPQNCPGGIMGMTTAQIFDYLQSGIFVKQKFDLLEVVTGCNREKKFYVYDHSPKKLDQKDGSIYFSCKESSSCIDRNCCPAAARPLNMLIYKGYQESGHFQNPILKIQRPCTCTCCCLNRPKMLVNYIENGANEYLGKVVHDFSCCDPIFTVRDTNDQVLYTIEADCCQCGLQCKGPCQACQRVEFKLWSGKREKLEGMMVKLGKKSLVKNILGSADNFSMTWPSVTDWRQKALLLASILLIDFSMFEQKDDERNAARNANA